jgi:hypothetical protein
MLDSLAIAATNTLGHEANIAKIQVAWGAHVSTTRMYDRRKMEPQDSI